MPNRPQTQTERLFLPLLTVPGEDVPVNRPPVAEDIRYQVDEDATLSVTAAAGVLTNDSDPDADPLAAILEDDVQQGTLDFSADGSFTYTPAPDFHGEDRFTYRAVDGVSASAPATVALVVAPINDAPVSADDAFVTQRNTPLTVGAAQGVLANDTDFEDDELTAQLVRAVDHGTLTLRPDGSFSYTPPPDFAGQDSFVYVANDGVLASNPATVTLTVQGTNRPPQIVTGVTTFDKHVIDNTVDEIHYAVGGDFDGDGDVDLAATDYVDGAVLWYENDGALSFTARVLDDALPGAYPAGTGDVDGDGDTDILAGGYLGDTFVWYRNDGGGALVRQDVDTEADGAHSIITADVDDDGDMDLVTTSQDAGTVGWYENDGTAAFTRRIVDADAAGAKRADAADLDNDGDMDLLAASFDANEIAWYENDGTQNFTKRMVNAAATGAYYVAAGDCDHDGDLDLFSASQLSNAVDWYENDGAGGFTARGLDSDVPGTRTVVVVDLNGDGHLDALATSVDFDAVYWYANDGGCNFTKHALDVGAAGAYGVAAVDIDGDHDMDVLSAARDANEVALYVQTRDHAATVAVSGTLTIDTPLLRATDPDNDPAELTYAITAAPRLGVLQLDGAPLTQGDSFTQADVDSRRVTYAHAGGSGGLDPIEFTVTDGVADGLRPAPGRVTVSVVAPGDQVVHLPLDEGEGTVAGDVSGAGNDGTLVNGARFEADPGDGSGFAVRFDGVDDRIDLGAVDVNGSGLTLAAWFNAASFPGPSSDPRLISKAEGVTADDHVFMLGTVVRNREMRLRVRVSTAMTTTTVIAAGGNIAAGEWHHAAATYDGEEVRLYLNGLEVGSALLTGAVSMDAAMPVAVGSQPAGAGTNAFDGLIDDVRILARPMSAVEIHLLVSAGR